MMKKQKKQKTIKSIVLSFVMCLLMAVSVIPAAVTQTFADETTETTGTTEKKVTVTSVTYTNGTNGENPSALISFMANHIYSGNPIAYLDPMIGRGYEQHEYDFDTREASNLPEGWSLSQNDKTNEWQLLCSPLNMTGNIGNPPEGEEIYVGVYVTSSDWVKDFDQLKLTVPAEGESVTVVNESTMNAATIQSVFVKPDGSPAPVPPSAKTEWVTFWDKNEPTAVIEAVPYPGYSVSPASYTLNNGDRVTFTYVQEPLEEPQNVKVKVVSMEEGTMKLEGGGAEITGTVATLEVSLDKAETPDEYWVGTLKENPDSPTGYDKMGSGNMPFIDNRTTPASFADGTGPNGETVSESVTEKGTRITIVKKVVKRDETTGSEFLDQEAYKTGDDIIVRVMSTRGQYEDYEESSGVDVVIPFQMAVPDQEFEPVQNFSDAVVVYPEGMDENSEYRESELDTITLKMSFSGKTLKKDKEYKKGIKVKINPETEKEEWEIEFTPVKPFTTGEPIVITLKKAKPEKEVITSVTLDHTSFIYNGEIQHANVTNVKAGDKTLSGSDYTVKYSLKNSKSAGTYTITVTGTGNYTGTKEVSYEIEPAPVTDATLSEVLYTYNRKVQKPALASVKSNNTTLTKNDYDAEYSNSNSKNKGEYSVTVTGRGNYTGSVEVLYHIVPAVVSSAALDKTTFTYNQKVQRCKIKEVKSSNGLVLTSDEYTVTYANPKSKDAGSYKLTVKGKGNFSGSVTKTYKIAKAEITKAALNKTEFIYNGKVQKASVKSVKAGDLVLTKNDYSAVWSNSKSTNAKNYRVTVTGKGNYTGSIEAGYVINPVKISKVSVDKTKYTYNKKAQRPLVTKVKAGDFALKKADYSITYSKKNSKDVGSYTVTVTAKNPNYDGKVTKTYIINPIGTNITKLTAGSKFAKATWKKQTTKMSETTITGYQIQASLTKDFKTIASKATVKGAAKTSSTLTKLKAGKNYYVRIRTYKTVGKKTYYSGWTTYKETVKVKK